VIDEVVDSLKQEMAGTLESLQRDLARVRTGRASPALLDGVMVDYYGTDTPLNKLGGVSAPESRLLVVQPFDQGALGDIEKAICKADLGLSPVNDGKILRVPIPELTEERRLEFVKQVKREGENHRVSARSHRRDANDMLKQLNSDKDISDDDLRKGQAQVQEIIDKAIEEIDAVVKAKEEDVMAV